MLVVVVVGIEMDVLVVVSLMVEVVMIDEALEVVVVETVCCIVPTLTVRYWVRAVSV